jgi:hypothetical protein
METGAVQDMTGKALEGVRDIGAAAITTGANREETTAGADCSTAYSFILFL